MNTSIKIITKKEELLFMPIIFLKYFLGKGRIKFIPTQKIDLEDVEIKEIDFLEKLGVNFSFNEITECYLISFRIFD